MAKRKSVKPNPKGPLAGPRETDARAYVEEAQAAYGMRGKQKVVEFMGLGTKNHLFEPDDQIFFIELIRKGIPRKAIDLMMTKTGLTEDEMAIVLHISKRTLQRRNSFELMNPDQSERLIELAKLYTKGQITLGSLDDFNEWMNQRHLTLGNKKPREFLDTSIGIHFLLDELGRIEHGIYS